MKIICIFPSQFQVIPVLSYIYSFKTSLGTKKKFANIWHTNSECTQTKFICSAYIKKIIDFVKPVILRYCCRTKRISFLVSSSGSGKLLSHCVFHSTLSNKFPQFSTHLIKNKFPLLSTHHIQDILSTQYPLYQKYFHYSVPPYQTYYLYSVPTLSNIFSLLSTHCIKHILSTQYPPYQTYFLYSLWCWELWIKNWFG